MGKKHTPSAPGPGPKPDKLPGCTCGDWKLVNGHWTQIFNPRCPHHGDDDEDDD